MPLAELTRDASPWRDPDLRGPVDRSLRFTADRLCPLAHAPAWATLDDAQRLRVNQLTGLMQNELIVFFETRIADTLLPVLLADASLPDDLKDALAAFLREERAHTAYFRSLNRASEPGVYGDADEHVLRLPRPALRATAAMARRPAAFPFLFWVMLVMEERSLLMSREVARQPGVDPRWAAVYRAHRVDEERHVETDWHLLDRFWNGRSAPVRRANALLLRAVVLGLFVKPRRANVRIVDLLIADHPALRPRRAELVGQVRGLDGNPGYRGMMYSAESTPLTRRLFERLPELRGLWRRMAPA